MRLRGRPQQVERAIRSTPEALSAETEAGKVYVKHAAWNTVSVDKAALSPNTDYSVPIGARSRPFHWLTRSCGHGIAAAIAFNGPESAAK